MHADTLASVGASCRTTRKGALPRFARQEKAMGREEGRERFCIGEGEKRGLRLGARHFFNYFAPTGKTEAESV